MPTDYIPLQQKDCLTFVNRDQFDDIDDCGCQNVFNCNRGGLTGYATVFVGDGEDDVVVTIVGEGVGGIFANYRGVLSPKFQL
jgi:hypothetical protein